MDGDPPRTPQSGVAWLNVTNTLLSLQNDIKALKDPEVRYALQTPPSTPRTPAELNAKIISLRTQLSEADDKLKDSKDSTLVALQRAARAEGEITELRKQRKESSQLHERAVTDATNRIQHLERQVVEIEDKSRIQILKSRDERERIHIVDSTAASERDIIAAQAQLAKTHVSRLQRELAMLKAEHEEERRNLARKQHMATRMNKELKKEVDHLVDKCSSYDKMKDNNMTELQYSNRQLEADILTLRSQLQEESAARVQLGQKLIEKEEHFARHHSQCESAQGREEENKYLSEELTLLRIQALEEQEATRNASALQSEKEELSRLICALSPTNIAQDGLEILRNLARIEGGVTDKNVGDRVIEQRYEQRIIAIRQHSDVQLVGLQERIVAGRLAVEALNIENARLEDEIEKNAEDKKRSELRKRILHREVDHLRGALREIEEVESESLSRSDDGRWRRRVEETEKVLSEYRSVLDNAEKELETQRTEISLLRSQTDSKFGSRSEQERNSSLQEADRLIEIETTARQEAEKKLKQANSRNNEVEALLREVRVKEEKTVSDSTPLDFDSTRVKALHVIDNPLSQAVRDFTKNEKNSKGLKRQRLAKEVEMSQADTAELEKLKKRMTELLTENEQLEKDSKLGRRTKEIALKKIEEVRSAIYNLFGWSMKMKGAKYTLASIYAESPNEVLEFGVNEEGTFALMENHYAMQLADEIQQYVQRMNSIPTLLANLTVENIQKTTLMNV